MKIHFHIPVTKSQVLALASLDKHHFGTEEQLLHDVCEQPGIYLWVGEAPGQPTAVLDQLVTTDDAVPVQIKDGNAQGGTGGLARVEEERIQGLNHSSNAAIWWKLCFPLRKVEKHWRKEPKFHSKIEVELNEIQMFKVALPEVWLLCFVSMCYLLLENV
jgi:hypothetical protein